MKISPQEEKIDDEPVAETSIIEVDVADALQSVDDAIEPVDDDAIDDATEIAESSYL